MGFSEVLSCRFLVGSDSCAPHVMLVLLGLSRHRYVDENISKLKSGCVWGFMWFFLMTYFFCLIEWRSSGMYIYLPKLFFSV